MDTQELKREAVKRVLARRLPPEFKTIYGSAGAGRIQVGPHREFAAPVTAAEWADDQLARLAAGAVGDVLAVILAGAQLGDDQAAAAVCSAQRLGPWDQREAWLGIVHWSDNPPPCAHSVTQAIRREWQRLGLQTGTPQEPHRAETRAYISTEHGDLVNTGRRH